MTEPNGRIAIQVRCGYCHETVTRLQNVGGDPPQYCGKTCARAAKRARRRHGQTHEPTQRAPDSQCVGCGVVAAQICNHWHMTSGPPEPAHVDHELGQRLRAAGFSRIDFTSPAT